MSVEIPLHNRVGHIVGYSIVSPEDGERIAAYPWHLKRNGYAFRSTHRIDGKQRGIGLHREVLGLTEPHSHEREVDHINGNKLDNRRENLRVVNRGVNTQNRPKGKCPNAPTRYKGVDFSKKSQKWRARISFQSEMIHIGYYETAEGAANAYNEKARELFGAGCYVNAI